MSVVAAAAVAAVNPVYVISQMELVCGPRSVGAVVEHVAGVVDADG